jgi:cysteine protease ATG4
MNYFCGERTKDSPKAHFLGREITEAASLQLHQQLLWLTYRKNIPITASLHSDVGWGCLIRVAQMAWAHSLQRHFSMLQKRVERNYIITPFLEGPDFKYGLLRFVEKGHALWGIKPGQWYTMTQAATTLEALHQEDPLKGS